MYPFEFVAYGGSQVMGMYPTLIIVIVNFRRTIWDEASSTAGNGVAVNTLHWTYPVRSGPSDTFGTERGVNHDLETAAFAGKSEILKRNMEFKEPSVQDA